MNLQTYVSFVVVPFISVSIQSGYLQITFSRTYDLENIDTATQNWYIMISEPQMFSMSQSYTLPLLTNGHAKGVTSLYTVAGEHFPVWIYIVKTGKIWKMVKNRDRVKESNIWLRTGSKSFLLPFFTFQWSSSEFDLEIGRPARNRELGQLHAAKTAKFWIEWGARSKQ